MLHGGQWPPVITRNNVVQESAQKPRGVPNCEVEEYPHPMLSVGIVGLPNVGKSTLFNALSAGSAEISNYPFTTIDRTSAWCPFPTRG